MKLTNIKEETEIFFDKETLRKLKERSVKEGRTISNIIEAAILKDTYSDLLRTELRRAAAVRFCSRPFNLNTKELKSLLNY